MIRFKNSLTLEFFWNGDLNDTVWLPTKGTKRWWHHKLQDGKLIDPVYA